MTRKNNPRKGLTRQYSVVPTNNTAGKPPNKWNERIAYRVMFLASIGLTEKQISIALDIHLHSISYWKRTKPEFLEALQKGKSEYTDRVEQSLVECATGYSHPAIHFAVIDGKVVQTPYTKHYTPSDTAMIFYLKNRARDRWQDVHKIEGAIQHRHILDLTNLSIEELKVLEKVGLKELPAHGDNVS